MHSFYNEDGLQVRKTATSTGTTNYTLHGKNIVHLVNGSNSLHFFYDARNRPAVVTYNGTDYGYIYNVQGDVIALVDSTGAKMVEYYYDAWGKPLSKTGPLASMLGTLNPFRYRGYVYDEEMGLYYLNARFYSPWLSRFCNADKQIERNLFTYCDNCPVNKVDSSGCSGEKLPDFTYALNNELERQLIMEFESHRIGDGTDNSPGFAIRNLPTFLWFAGKWLMMARLVIKRIVCGIAHFLLFRVQTKYQSSFSVDVKRQGRTLAILHLVISEARLAFQLSIFSLVRVYISRQKNCRKVKQNMDASIVGQFG